jgi:hypothetical protein
MPGRRILAGTGSVATLALVLAGCAGNETVKAYEAWADEACACADASCRSTAIARGVRLAQDSQTARGTLKDSHAIEAAARRAAKCLDALAASAPGANVVDAGVTP